MHQVEAEVKTRLVQVNRHIWVNPAQVTAVYNNATGVVVDVSSGGTFQVDPKIEMSDVIDILDGHTTYEGRINR